MTTVGIKRVLITDQAQKELNKFSVEVSDKFFSAFRIINRSGELPGIVFKKLSGYNLFEFRVKYKGCVYRGIGSVIDQSVVIVRFFQKKSQKTPTQEIDLILQRIKIFKNNDRS